MRLLAISIVILAGALVSGAGAIANAVFQASYIKSNVQGLHAVYYSELESHGIWLAGAGLVIFVIEWWMSKNSRAVAADETAAESRPKSKAD